MKTIDRTSLICMHFEIALEDGQVVDSNFDKKPAEFTFGDGNLLAPFEEVLLGLQIDDEKEFVMSPEKAFGQHNPSNIQSMSRDQFESDIEEGMIMSFSDVGKNELPGVITAIDEKEVLVDFNHPLAGRTLAYRVQIIDIKETL